MNAKHNRRLPVRLVAAYDWTRNADELETLKILTGADLDAYIRDSARNAAFYGEHDSVNDGTLLGLHLWLNSDRRERVTQPIPCVSLSDTVDGK